MFEAQGTSGHQVCVVVTATVTLLPFCIRVGAFLVLFGMYVQVSDGMYLCDGVLVHLPFISAILYAWVCPLYCHNYQDILVWLCVCVVCVHV